MTKAMRFNKGKLRLDLIPFEWEEELAEILTFGAVKYADNNWKNSLNTKDHKKFVEDRLASLRRHLLSWQKGSLRDKESNRYHLGHVAWNALCIMWYDIYRRSNVRNIK